MADVMFNVGKGRAVELYKRVKDNDPANSAFVIILLKATVSDTLIIDFLDLASLLADVSVTEADFTNYVRIEFSDVQLAALPVPDTATDVYPLTFPDAQWANAGGALNNTMTKLLLCFDYDTTSGTDTDIVPIAAFDFAGTTDGATLTLQFPAAAFSAA